MTGNVEKRILGRTGVKNGHSVEKIACPKVKIQCLKKDNVRNKDSRNILTGNVKRLTAMFDHSDGGEQTTEVNFPDSSLLEKILNFKIF